MMVQMKESVGRNEHQVQNTNEKKNKQKNPPPKSNAWKKKKKEKPHGLVVENHKVKNTDLI